VGRAGACCAARPPRSGDRGRGQTADRRRCWSPRAAARPGRRCACTRSSREERPRGRGRRGRGAILSLSTEDAGPAPARRADAGAQTNETNGRRGPGAIFVFFFFFPRSTFRNAPHPAPHTMPALASAKATSVARTRPCSVSASASSAAAAAAPGRARRSARPAPGIDVGQPVFPLHLPGVAGGVWLDRSALSQDVVYGQVRAGGMGGSAGAGRRGGGASGKKKQRGMRPSPLFPRAPVPSHPPAAPVLAVEAWPGTAHAFVWRGSRSAAAACASGNARAKKSGRVVSGARSTSKKKT
jgi:hypothetical protein